MTRFLRNESGATAIEYGLIVALIFLAIITGVTAFASGTEEKYKYINDNIQGVL